MACASRCVEQLPVAAVELGGIRTAVAADGAVLGPALAQRLAAERRRGLRTPAARRGDRPVRQRGHAAQRADRARRRARALRQGGRAGVQRAAGGDRRDAQRAARLLRRRHAAARQVAVACARAARPELRGRLLRRCPRAPNAPPRASPAVSPPTGPADGRHGILARRGIGPSSASEPTTTAELAAGLAAALGTSPGSPAAHEAPTASQAQSQAAHQAPRGGTGPRRPAPRPTAPATPGSHRTSMPGGG